MSNKTIYKIVMESKDADILNNIIDDTMFNNIKKGVAIKASRKLAEGMVFLSVIDTRKDSDCLYIYPAVNRKIATKYCLECGTEDICQNRPFCSSIDREEVYDILHKQINIKATITTFVGDIPNERCSWETAMKVFNKLNRAMADLRPFIDQDVAAQITENKIEMFFTKVNAIHPMFFFT